MLRLNNFLKFWIILLSLLWLNISGICNELKTSTQAPQITTEQKSKSSLETKTDIDKTKQATTKFSVIVKENKSPEQKYNSKNNRQESANQGAEFCIFSGYRFRITDLALVVFTFVLAICTAGLWFVTWRAMVSTQRSFVFLKDIEFNEIRTRGDYKVTKWKLLPRWENSGDTQTKKLTISIGCIILYEELPDDFNFPYISCNEIPHINAISTIPIMIGPKANILTEYIEVPETDMEVLDHFTQPDMHNFHKIYVWGEAKYKDIFWFTKQHTTQFCIELFFTEQISSGIRREPIMSFNYYKKYNYAD